MTEPTNKPAHPALEFVRKPRNLAVGLGALGVILFASGALTWEQVTALVALVWPG